MIRLILENMLLLLAPTLLYVIFIMSKRSGDKNNTITRAFDTAPLVPLFALGFILMVSVLAYFGSKSTGGKPGQIYHPPEIVDGKVKPGRFE